MGGSPFLTTAICLLMAGSVCGLTRPCEVVYPPNCSRQVPGSLHPHEQGCHLFYRCDELGTAQTFVCPLGHQFLNESAVCIPAHGVECGRCSLPPPECPLTTPPPCMTSPQPTTIGTCPPGEPCRPGEAGQLKPYPPDCSRYVYCAAGAIAELRYCPVEQHFSPTERSCKDRSVANCPLCEEEVTSPPVSTTVGVCPPTQTCGEDYHFLPYPVNCSMYIYCDGTLEGVLSTCPEDQQFSPLELICLPEEQAECSYCEEGSTTPSYTTETTPLTSTTAGPCGEPEPCDAPGKLKPVPRDCGKYLYCTEEGGAELSMCPAGQHFSPTELRCMDPAEAACPYCIPPSSTALTTERPVPTLTVTFSPSPCGEPHVCEVSERGQLYPWPGDCSKYLYCYSGVSIVRRCPLWHEFSPSQLRCLPRLLSDCEDCVTNTVWTEQTSPGTTTSTEQTSSGTTTWTEVTTPITTSTNAPPACPPIPECSIFSIDEYLPYPPDCTKYIHCSFGLTLIKDCYGGQHWSSEKKQCMDPALANCEYCTENGETTPVQTTPTVSSTTTIPYCAAIPSCEPEFIGTIPYPPDCTMYIYCEEGVEELSNCTPGLHYDLDTGNCKEPELANCPTCIETTVATSPPTEPTTLPYCPEVEKCAPGQFGTLPFPTDCTRFIYCEDGVTHMNKCPAGREFSVERGVCLDPAIANCPRCIYTTVTEPSTTTLPPEPTLPPCPPQETCEGKPTGAQLPVYTDCSLYIYCDTGVPYESICFGDEVFNPNIGGPGDGACFPPSEFTCPYCTVLEEGKPVEQKKKSLWFLT